MVKLTKEEKEAIKQVIMNKEFNRRLEEEKAKSKPKFTTDAIEGKRKRK